MTDDPGDPNDDDFDPGALVLPDEVVKETKLQAHPAQYQACVDIARLINDVRRATALSDYRSLQQRLGQHIADVEAKVGDAKERRSHLDRALRRLRRRLTPATPAEIAAIEAEQEQAELDRTLYLRLARQYRLVGDAMAWQLYDFQTRVIAALGMNASPGIIGPKEGAAGEVEQVESYWRDHGAFALRHDYTNCLRVCDLSIFYPERVGSGEIIEVKGPGGKVRSKQKNRARNVAEFIQHQVMTAEDGVLMIHRHQTPQLPDGPEQSNFSLTVRAVMEAARSGFGTAHNSYLAVTALNMFHPDVRQPNRAMRSKIDRIRDTPQEITVRSCQDYLRADSHQKVLASTSAFGAPYSVYLLPPNAVAALITGFLRVLFHLNTCAVIDAFKSIGFETHFIPPQNPPAPSEPPASADELFILRRGDFTTWLGPNVIGQMLFEGLPLEDLVASIRAEYETRAGRSNVLIPRIVGPYPRREHVLTTFLGLENIWRASREITLPDEELPS